MNPPPLNHSQQAEKWVSAAIEACVLLLVIASPWALGAIQPQFQHYFYMGLALMLVLWGLLTVLRREVRWTVCPVLVGIGLLFVVGIVQTAPLPPALLQLLAPGNAQIHQQLRPQHGEQLAGTKGNSHSTAAGSTISLYPAATRDTMLPWLAAFVTFFVVRSALSSTDAFRRLSIAALVNGSLLSLFGLIQFFSSSDRGLIYWSIPSAGQAFGPFVNRNHFAFYINICIGLGFGLLLSRRSELLGSLSASRSKRARGAPPRWNLAELLHDPPALWICCGLAIMLSSVPMSLSRGGVTALLGALAIGFVVATINFPAVWRSGAIVVSITAALALLTWFGWEQLIESRLATLWTGGALDSRLPMWSEVWPYLRDFPVWGTGYGTFQYVEPLHLHTPELVGSIYAYAHNEYLEAVIEGGVLRLMLTAGTIALVFHIALRRFRQCTNVGERGLVFGGLFAFSTVVIHSVGEFAIHLPAIAMLVVVLCAQLVATRTGKSPAAASGGSMALSRSAPFLAAGVAVMLAWIFIDESGKLARAHQLQRQAYTAATARGAASLPEQHQLLSEAVGLRPRDANLRFALAEVLLDLYAEQAKPLSTEGDAERLSQLQQALLYPGLRHCLTARDHCPLLPAAHVRIAAHVERFERADPRSAYLDRAKRLAPADAFLWYACGVQELADHRPEAAWHSFRRMLELSPEYLPVVLNHSLDRLSPLEVLERILPDDPGVLLAAADQMYPETASDERRPFLERALKLLTRQRQPLDGQQLYIKAQAHRQFEQFPDALAALRAAVRREPDQIGWRYELADLLFQQEQFAASRRELKRLLGLQPRHPDALQLLDQIETSESGG